MAQWTNPSLVQQFWQLPFLCEKTGVIALTLLGLTAC